MKAYQIKHLEELKQEQIQEPVQIQLELPMPTMPMPESTPEQYDSEVNFEVDSTI